MAAAPVRAAAPTAETPVVVASLEGAGAMLLASCSLPRGAATASLEAPGEDAPAPSSVLPMVSSSGTGTADGALEAVLAAETNPTRAIKTKARTKLWRAIIDIGGVREKEENKKQ